mmetsp:Transcript_38038/g.119387  ORF Transcript_38038/g.119387 Transcript_38038/m.119387 type:complete len:228 (+) Transcript_38038:1737-2420(+)
MRAHKRAPRITLHGYCSTPPLLPRAHRSLTPTPSQSENARAIVCMYCSVRKWNGRDERGPPRAGASRNLVFSPHPAARPQSPPLRDRNVVVCQELLERLDALLGGLELLRELHGVLLRHEGGGLRAAHVGARGHGGHLGRLVRAAHPLVGGVARLPREALRVEVLLEGVGLARHDEGERHDAVRGELEELGRLAAHDVDAALRHHAHALLGLRTAVLANAVAKGALV